MSSPLARKSKDKPRSRLSVLDIMKKLITVTIIIFAIALIIYNLPELKVLKMNFPPVF